MIFEQQRLTPFKIELKHISEFCVGLSFGFVSGSGSGFSKTQTRNRAERFRLV
jgi:hypothetical protein